MQQTNKLKLYTFDETDDIIDTIEKIGVNMEKLDNAYQELIGNISMDLEVGKKYDLAYKVWNKFPQTGGISGWINVREGVFAKKWVADKSYNIGDLIVPTTDNGHYYQCIVEGTSNSVPPNFNTGTTSITNDNKNATVWQPNYSYKVGDIVLSKNGDTTYFYKCVTAGVTNSDEPIWNQSSATYDGSVVWNTVKKVQWREMGSACNFRPMGTIL